MVWITMGRNEEKIKMAMKSLNRLSDKLKIYEEKKRRQILIKQMMMGRNEERDYDKDEDGE